MNFDLFICILKCNEMFPFPKLYKSCFRPTCFTNLQLNIIEKKYIAQGTKCINKSDTQKKNYYEMYGEPFVTYLPRFFLRHLLHCSTKSIAFIVYT